MSDMVCDMQAAFVRGSRMAADNLGVTLPQWSVFDDERMTGRMLLKAFDDYVGTNHVEHPGDVRRAIQDEWGLLDGPREKRVTVGDVLAHYGGLGR